MIETADLILLFVASMTLAFVLGYWIGSDDARECSKCGDRID